MRPAPPPDHDDPLSDDPDAAAAAGEHSEPGSAAESASLRELVQACVLRIEDEGMAVVDEFCAARPEHAAVLRQRIDALARAGLLEDGGSSALAAPVGIPEQLGEFRLLDRLGSGGMGIVYRARQESLDREVALKLVRPESLFFPGARSRFRREIEAATRLDHPGIVQVHAIGEERGIPWFTMELVRGTSLNRIVQDLRPRDIRRLTAHDLAASVEAHTIAHPARRESTSDLLDVDLYRGSWVQCCCRIALRIAEALDHAHERGVLHRDVKPSNVMLTPHGEVRLLDFGLAQTAAAAPEGRAATADPTDSSEPTDPADSSDPTNATDATDPANAAEKLTRSGALLGTLPYMAPEQVRGDRDGIDERTDVYGLGATLYELLTLHTPFEGGDAGELRERILAAAPLPPTGHNASVPRDVETICLHAMAAEPRRRYASAADLARDLRHFLALEPIEARRPSSTYRLRRFAQRHPAKATAALAALLIGTVGPLLFAVQESFAAERERRAADTLRSALDARHREHERAEVNLAQAHRAIDRMVRSLDRPELAKVEGMDEVRRATLAEAVTMYEQLRPSPAEHNRYAWLRATTLLNVATLRMQLGEDEAAGVDLLAVRQQLADIDAQGAQVRLVATAMVRCLHKLAVVHMNTSRVPEATRYLHAALEENRALIAADPLDWDRRSQQIGLLHGLGIIDQRAGRYGDARARLDAIEALLDGADGAGGNHAADPTAAPVEAGHGNDADAHTDANHEEAPAPLLQIERASVYSNRARIAYLEEDFPAARRWYDECIACLERPVAGLDALPMHEQIRRVRFTGDLYFDCSNLAAHSPQPERVLPLARRALAEREKLVELAPDHLDHRSALAMARSHVGEHLAKAGEHEEALLHMREATRQLESVLAMQPRHPNYRSQTSIALATLAELESPADAAPLRRKAHALMEGLVAEEPGLLVYRENLAMLLLQWGRATTAPLEALPLAEAATRHLRQVLAARPDSDRLHRILGAALMQAAGALTALDRPDAAIAAAREAIEDHGFPAAYLDRSAYAPLRGHPAFDRLRQRPR